MRAWLVIVIIAGLAFGCSTGPPGRVDFAEIDHLSELDGIYQNIGEAAFTVYLSRVIWPEADYDFHNRVTAVEVRANGDKELRVMAIREDDIEKEQTFYRGEHFEFESGRLVLKHGFGFHIPKEDGDVALGLTHKTIEIGISEQGHGKIRDKTSFAGVAFLVVPFVVAGGYDDMRFIKIGD